MSLDGYKCEAGFSASVVLDLQRVYACVAVNEPRDPEAEPVDQEFLSQVASANSSFSTRVVMPMSSNAEWRQVRNLKSKHIEPLNKLMNQ